jgi:PBSX family phage portal protein
MSDEFQPPQTNAYVIERVLKADSQEVVSSVPLQVEDVYVDMYYTASNTSGRLIQPPFNPLTLKNMVFRNNILAQCVEAMEVNIAGSGWEIRQIPGEKKEDEKEYQRLFDFFQEPFPGMSWTTLRRKIRVDLESTGNAYIEVLRTGTNKIAFFRYLDASLMRMVRLDQPVTVEKTVMRQGEPITLKINIRERKFAQMVGMKLQYYKEYGCDRRVNRKNGEWVEDGKALQADEIGTEVIHLTVKTDAQTPYGLPRWINNTPSVLGSRKAEEFNLGYFDAGGLPPAVVFLKGGSMAADVADTLRGYLSGKVSDKQRAVIIETYSNAGSLDSNTRVDVSVERFGWESTQDAMFQNYDKQAEEHIRSAFRLPPLFLGKSHDLNFACHDDETETLTNLGWVKWYDFDPSTMKVAAYDPEARSIEFVKPLGDGPLVYEAEDVSMYHFKNQGIDLMVTPNHRMMYQSLSTGGLSIVPVEGLVNLARVKFVLAPKAYRALENDLEFIDIPHEPVYGGVACQDEPLPPLNSLWFLSWVGYMLGDGCLVKSKGSHVMKIQAKKPKKVELFKSLFLLLEQHGFRVSIKEQKTGYWVFTVSHKGMYNWFMRECGSTATEKRIPEQFMSLPAEYLSVLFEALMSCDGSEGRGGAHRTYSSTSKMLSDQVQTIAFLLGYSASQKVAGPGSYGKSPVYNLNITQDRETCEINLNHQVARVPYTGKVYCFSVPTGVFVTRRNGKISVQGNSAYASYLVAEAQVFGPERQEEDEIINNILRREFGAKKYHIHSLPMNVKDVAIQLKAIDLIRDRIDPEHMVNTVNDIVNLDVDYDDETYQYNKSILNKRRAANYSDSATDYDQAVAGTSKEDK